MAAAAACAVSSRRGHFPESPQQSFLAAAAAPDPPRTTGRHLHHCPGRLLLLPRCGRGRLLIFCRLSPPLGASSTTSLRTPTQSDQEHQSEVHGAVRRIEPDAPDGLPVNQAMN